MLRLRVQSPAWEEMGWRRRKDEIPAEKMGMGNPRQEKVAQVLCQGEKARQGTIKNQQGLVG